MGGFGIHPTENTGELGEVKHPTVIKVQGYKSMVGKLVPLKGGR